MIEMILYLLAMMLIPGIIIKLECRHSWMEALGAVIFCYLVGIILSSFKLVPIDLKIVKTFAEVMLLISLPLLLFSTHIPLLIRLTPKMVLSFSLCCFSVLVSAFTVSFLVFPDSPIVSDLAASCVALFTGGTVNFSALSIATQMDHNLFVLINASDMLVCGIYFLLILKFGNGICRKFLPRDNLDLSDFEKFESSDDSVSWSLTPTMMKGVLFSLGLSLLLVAITAGSSSLFFGQLETRYIILTLTTLALAMSFFTKVRGNKYSYPMGDYLLLVFCLCLGQLIELNSFVEMGPEVMAYIALVVTLTALIFLGISALLKVNSDISLIAHIASLYGPAFVVVVCKNIKNKTLIAPGIAIALLGYAVGTYLGIFSKTLIQGYLQ